MPTLAELNATIADQTPDTLRDALFAALEPYDQTHILRHWNELTIDEQQSLARQVAGIDFEQLGRLKSGDVYSGAEYSNDDVTPPPTRMANGETTSESARIIGEQMLKNGAFGVVIVAGGQGSRLGFEHPKGMYPIGPVTNKTLFQILVEKIRGRAAEFETSIPLYLMTSPATHAETVEFFEQNDRFGLAEDELFIFCQGTMPAVTEPGGKLLLSNPSTIFMSPDGHGGMVAALENSGALSNMQQRGIEHVFYCQVDNALVEILDPEFVGYHVMANSDATTQVVACTEPGEKLGRVVSIDGRVQIIEYSDMPEELSHQRDEDGRLTYRAGNVALHTFSMTFIEEAAASDSALPFHVAHKKVPHVTDEGDVVKPETPNAIKFERFIFDLLPMAKRALVVEARRDSVFAPLKNAAGADSADDVRQKMSAEFSRWLKESGNDVPEGTTAIEISPLWAQSANNLEQNGVNGTAQGGTWYIG